MLSRISRLPVSFVVVFLLSISRVFAQAPPILPGELPDLKLTPGKTALVRQPRIASMKVRLLVWHLYGYDTKIGPYKEHSADYEIDHLIPLALNGSNDTDNLWPQPRKGNWTARMKDHLEDHIEAKFKRGAITLKEAQGKFTPNWIDAYKAEGLPNPSPKPDKQAQGEEKPAASTR